MHRRLVLTRLVLVFLVLLAVFPANARENTARTIVERFHDSLLVVMKNAGPLGIKGRYEHLAPEIEQAFHLPLMAQITAGSFWRKATDTQREQLVKAFSHLSIGTYAAQFKDYSGQVFETLGERSGPQKTTLVQTRIVSPGTNPVGLTYVTKKIKGQWRIVDILLDNDISELAVRRSEYRQVLKKSGVDGLIATLTSKADALVTN
jgi:phospholipid transport system substrate-binding protein